jgi:hypothetical protein
VATERLIPTWLKVLATLCGLGLFVGLVVLAGPREILAQVERLGFVVSLRQACLTRIR